MVTSKWVILVFQECNKFIFGMKIPFLPMQRRNCLSRNTRNLLHFPYLLWGKCFRQLG